MLLAAGRIGSVSRSLTILRSIGYFNRVGDPRLE